ncbi:MAG: hypothetical protein AMJ66_06190 [Betaproteobacteria bacterium SG8_40]|nr:MAG: hypothetical protein AMJ66_06190 [Betaproteobacteria bacterium SG8_40]
MFSCSTHTGIVRATTGKVIACPVRWRNALRAAAIRVKGRIAEPGAIRVKKIRPGLTNEVILQTQVAMDQRFPGAGGATGETFRFAGAFGVFERCGTRIRVGTERDEYIANTKSLFGIRVRGSRAVERRGVSAGQCCQFPELAGLDQPRPRECGNEYLVSLAGVAPSRTPRGQGGRRLLSVQIPGWQFQYCTSA